MLCININFVDVLLFLFSSTKQIQSWVRMSLARKKYLERSKYFKDHVRLSVELGVNTVYLNLFAGFGEWGHLKYNV